MRHSCHHDNKTASVAYRRSLVPYMTRRLPSPSERPFAPSSARAAAPPPPSCEQLPPRQLFPFPPLAPTSSARPPPPPPSRAPSPLAYCLPQSCLLLRVSWQLSHSSRQHAASTALENKPRCGFSSQRLKMALSSEIPLIFSAKATSRAISVFQPYFLMSDANSSRPMLLSQLSMGSMSFVGNGRCDDSRCHDSGSRVWLCGPNPTRRNTERNGS